MSQFLQPSFSVNVGGKDYSAGWDRIFGAKEARGIQIGDRVRSTFSDSTFTVGAFDNDPENCDGVVGDDGAVHYWEEIRLEDGTPIDVTASKMNASRWLVRQSAETEPAPSATPTGARPVKVGDVLMTSYDFTKEVVTVEEKGCRVRFEGNLPAAPEDSPIYLWEELKSHKDGAPIDREASLAQPAEEFVTSAQQDYERGYELGYQVGRNEGLQDGSAAPRPDVFKEGYDAGISAASTDSISGYQRRVLEWASHNFPLTVTVDHRRKALEFMEREMYGLQDTKLSESLAHLLAASEGRNHRPLIGAVEELGELCHAHLKNEQGIRGTPEEHLAAKKDAIGDALIYLLDYCNKEGVSMQECLEIAWAETSARDWIRFPKNGRSE